jgi:hypothetical protein
VILPIVVRKELQDILYLGHMGIGINTLWETTEGIRTVSNPEYKDSDN